MKLEKKSFEGKLTDIRNFLTKEKNAKDDLAEKLNLSRSLEEFFLEETASKDSQLQRLRRKISHLIKELDKSDREVRRLRRENNGLVQELERSHNHYRVY